MNTADKDQTTLLNFQQFLNSANTNIASNLKTSDPNYNELKLDMSFCNPGFVNMENQKIADHSDKMDIDKVDHNQILNVDSVIREDKNNINESNKPKQKKAKAKTNKEEDNKENTEDNKEEVLKKKKKNNGKSIY